MTLPFDVPIWRRPGFEEKYGSEMWLRGAQALLGAALRVPCALNVTLSQSKTPLLQAARAYARPVRRKKPEITSHLDDLPPTMLQWKYTNVPAVNQVDDVVRRLLSLEMASQKEKLKIKKEQLADKVRKAPNDKGSFEVQIAYLTAKIRTLQEHLHMHPKDKFNRRHMMMAIDRRRKLLKYLRRSRYDAFEKTCQQLGIEYTPPPAFCRRITRRWVAKKALCLKVFQEAQKLKAEGKLKPRQRAPRRTKSKKKKVQQTKGTPV
ncbi:small ribosomal subunit protein uS15m [Anolis carolinensis]|uniref:Small ribosomal subunit protein uS15m n=1 Tax=Anolis carolinensis TaxID=28377 RepID=H9GRC8_ANOCA|nr:PREDICTED: 28S ribosomal protein S15, mitochondrial [Anolis carolinensis]|eukprot:XP_016853345.1 PREDICTED: 28S ribosomal protein S15, mitochondrial [Anolis carolinensis]